MKSKNLGIIKTSPSVALASLRELNEKTLLLLNNCDALIKNNCIREEMLPIFKHNVDSLREIYDRND